MRIRAVLRVLQLSDFHFGPNHGFAQVGDAHGRTLADVLVRSLERANEPLEFDAVILNGDLLTFNDGDERAKAEDGIRGLQEALTINVLGSVPGNHDISWDGTLRPDERLVFYEAILGRLAPHLPRPAEFPHVLRIDASNESIGLALILLDSCRIESKIQAGLGFVGGDQLDLIATRLAEAGVSAETHNFVAVLHHHLIPVSQAMQLPQTADPDSSPRMVVSVTVDATDVLRELARYGVSVVMHGHQHVHGVLSLSSSRWTTDMSLHIGACGSCGTDEVGVRRHFQLWEFEDGKATAVAFEEDPNDREIFVEVTRRTLVLRTPQSDTASPAAS